MFFNTGVTELDLSAWTTPALTSTVGMFEDAMKLTKLNISGLNTEKVDNMRSMFKNVYSLEAFRCEYIKDRKGSKYGYDVFANACIENIRFT